MYILNNLKHSTTRLCRINVSRTSVSYNKNTMILSQSNDIEIFKKLHEFSIKSVPRRTNQTSRVFGIFQHYLISFVNFTGLKPNKPAPRITDPKSTLVYPKNPKSTSLLSNSYNKVVIYG